MSMATRWPLAIIAGCVLTACAHVPTGPGIAALRGSAKTAEEFRSDDAVCRQASASEPDARKQWRYGMAYLQCMYAKGNQILVPRGMYEPTR
jgi:outer membrane PBP1 activator LpoA protein